MSTVFSYRALSQFKIHRLTCFLVFYSLTHTFSGFLRAQACALSLLQSCCSPTSNMFIGACSNIKYSQTRSRTHARILSFSRALVSSQSHLPMYLLALDSLARSLATVTCLSTLTLPLSFSRTQTLQARELISKRLLFPARK